MKKLIILNVLICLIVAAGFLASVDAAATDGGKLIVGRPGDSVSLDAAADTTGPGTIVYGNITETLITLEPDGSYKPRLATSYEIMAPDRIRFHLRKGVKFHDGTPFNAQAVKFTFDRAVKLPARWLSLFGPFKEAQVIDDYTVDIITAVPYGPLLSSMTMVYTGIISPTAAEKYGDDYGRNPVGTGPFKFKSWKAKDNIIIVRNDDYWGEKPHLSEVMYRVIPEAGARMMALRTGEVDIVVKPNPSDLPAFSKDAKFTVASVMGNRVFFNGFNTLLPPTDDVRVRQALSMAVDVKGIVDNILEGAAAMPKSYLGPTVFGFSDMHLQERYPYNPEKAKALLAEAGWKDSNGDGILDKDGKNLTIRFLGAKNRYLMDAESCEAVQAMFQKIGVETKLDFFEWSATFSLIRGEKLDYNLITAGWVLPNPDADVSLYALFHSSSFLPKGWNFCRFKDPRIDQLLDEARASGDQAKRKVMYKEIQDTLAEQAVWIPIYVTKETYVMSSKVKGFVSHPVEYIFDLQPVWIEQ
jgi:peptide/nickel transport system substrate-binding protein